MPFRSRSVCSLVTKVFCPFLWIFVSCITSCFSTAWGLSIGRRHFLTSTTSSTAFLSSQGAQVSFMSSPLTAHAPQKATLPTSAKNVVRWGIVGLGDVTQVKSGPPFYLCEGSELAAVMRRTPGKAAEWAQRVPGGQCVGYEDLESFLKHPGLDAVYVATPPQGHAEVGQAVLKAGKAVYVEKPVGRCAAETAALVQASQENQVPLYTAYISRAYERTQTLRRLLHEDQVIGDKLESIHYTVVGTGGARGLDGDTPWRLNAARAGGGLIMDIGCHVLDRIDYLFGPLTQVQGEAKNINSPQIIVEDYVQLQATIGPTAVSLDNKQRRCFSEGAKVYCEWDFTGRESTAKDELVLKGNKGSIRMVGMSPSLPITILDMSGKVIQEVEFDTPAHTAQGLVQAVTDHLLGKRTVDYLSFGDNALRTSKVLDQVLGSYYGGRDIGYWGRPETWPGRPKSS